MRKLAFLLAGLVITAGLYAADGTTASALTTTNIENKSEVKKEEAIKIPEFLKDFKFGGAFRFRYENKNDKGKELKDDTLTLRAKFGFTKKVNEKFDFTYWWTTDNTEIGDNISSKGIKTEQASLKYNSKYSNVYFGKFENPLWRPAEKLLWRDDLKIEGIAVNSNIKANEKLNLFFNEQYLIKVKETDKGDQSAAVFQAGALSNLGANKITGAIEYVKNIGQGKNYPNSAVIEGQYTYLVGKDKPIKALSAIGQFAKSDADSEDAAYIAGLILGDEAVKEKGQYRIIASYRKIEANSWGDKYGDTDFVPGKKGYNIRAELGIEKNTNLAIQYSSIETIGNSEAKVGKAKLEINTSF